MNFLFLEFYLSCEAAVDLVLEYFKNIQEVFSRRGYSKLVF